MRDTVQVTCPYCGQTNEIYIDFGGGRNQDYVEDCQVCCRPWEVHVFLGEEEPVVRVLRSDE